MPKLEAKPMTLNELVQASPKARLFWFDLATREMMINILIDHAQSDFVLNYDKDGLINLLVDFCEFGTRGYRKMRRPELIDELKSIIHSLTEEPLTPQDPSA